ncbi:hypothetical protein COEREDRAFT_82822 [Coemansia reversa NRRL 1564]|uniref:MalT-like TPR region domain-containing protein n=1 Tax=Coemansia reversa (strain ATCC 12441 / NRRL 1564) TaxID=763665 RepID=A0A2G5B5M2_COERN|nr:hypothetical protein COEREDRAFT_82822 [Coemansia reversa NRRL 1564]|eukprot:PIA14301.1 hypothetical protein COEREDRAFT_82822 [Coemansia reversa NRRL 1564]
MRMYTSESMLKGTPRFTRINWSRKQAREELVSSTAWLKLTPRNIIRVISRGAIAVSIVGVCGIAIYYGTIYHYLVSYWPVSDEIKGVVPRHMFYLARYYEFVNQNPAKELQALERAQSMTKDDPGLSDPSSLVDLDIKLRIAKCQYDTGNTVAAAQSLEEILPTIQSMQLGPQVTYADDRYNHTDKWISPDMFMYRLAAILGNIYVGEGSVSRAIQVYSLGLQAVKRMKAGIAGSFNPDHPLDYTAYDNIDLKESLLTLHLGIAFYIAKDYGIAETLLQSTLQSVRRHNVRYEAAPYITVDPRSFKNDWLCLDSRAMLYLARMRIDSGNLGDALPWIVSGRKQTTLESTFHLPQCIDCESGLISQLGRIAEAQGKPKRALRRYRQAYQYSRLNFVQNLDALAADVNRLESMM